LSGNDDYAVKFMQQEIMKRLWIGFFTNVVYGDAGGKESADSLL